MNFCFSLTHSFSRRKAFLMFQQINDLTDTTIAWRRVNTQQMGQERIDAGIVEQLSAYISVLEVRTFSTEGHAEVRSRGIEAVVTKLHPSVLGHQPTIVRQRHDGSHIRIRSVTQIGRHVFPTPHAQMGRPFQSFQNVVLVPGLRKISVGRSANTRSHQSGCR